MLKFYNKPFQFCYSFYHICHLFWQEIKVTQKIRLSTMSIELNFIKEMFDTIAPKYDFLNRFLSFGQDIVWRKLMVKAAMLEKNDIAIDAACGTCDVALEIQAQHKDKVQVLAFDFSFEMLKLGKKKTKKLKKIKLLSANALNLPFKYNSFDAVFIAFGIRNIMDRSKVIKEFYNLLKTKKKLVVLELTMPKKGLLSSLYLVYFQKILPAIGSIFSKDKTAYSYLPASVFKFLTPKEFAKLMHQSGFKNIKFKQMTFGIVTLFVGTKL